MQPTRKICAQNYMDCRTLTKAMSKACPGSRWNENILLWHQKILDDIPIYNRKLSGYIVPLFMSTWEDERPHLPFIKDVHAISEDDLRWKVMVKIWAETIIYIMCHHKVSRCTWNDLRKEGNSLLTTSSPQSHRQPKT
ncbi:hypothetical protein D1007_21581 [Hordeum vulgare]|nr:hypothetical protein D1007_21581 [Hordeum vulgare]